MEWDCARERLGAELIGARETVAARCRLALRDRGTLAWSLESCAAELVLHAGAALADGARERRPGCAAGAFGGVKALCWTGGEDRADVRAA